MKKITCQLLLMPLFCLFCIAAFSQNTISGTVTTDSLKPLSGVMVGIQGTTVSTLTDQDGRYGISAGDEVVLVFRRQGYIAQEVPTHGRNQVNVMLQRSRDSTHLNVQLSGAAFLYKKAAPFADISERWELTPTHNLFIIPRKTDENKNAL